VINGHWGAAYSNYEHEKIAEELGHLPAAKVGAPQGLLGDKGIVDVTVLMGWFTGVSPTLKAFDVPSSATGLDQ
jgi:4-carboxymuconolactone decarboxylase